MFVASQCGASRTARPRDESRIRSSFQIRVHHLLGSMKSGSPYMARKDEEGVDVDYVWGTWSSAARAEGGEDGGYGGCGGAAGGTSEWIV